MWSFPGRAMSRWRWPRRKRRRFSKIIVFEVPLRLASPTSVQTVLRKRPDEPTLIEVYSTADPAGPWMRNFAATTVAHQPGSPRRRESDGDSPALYKTVDCG